MIAATAPTPLRSITISGKDYPLEPYFLGNNSDPDSENQLNAKYISIVRDWILKGTPDPQPKLLPKGFVEKFSLFPVDFESLSNAAAAQMRTTPSILHWSIFLSSARCSAL